MLSAYVEFAPDVDSGREREICAHLDREGIGVESGGSAPFVCPIVLACGELRQGVESRLAALADHPRRILLLWTAPGPPSSELAWRSMDAGASDVLHWQGATTAADIRCRLSRWQEIDALLEEMLRAHAVIGRSAAFLTAMRRLVEAAHFTDDAILITGETGTGKELAARMAHALDRKRSGRPLTVVDSGAIVPTLSGSEFFGHERGAFTGAVAARDGAFARARGSMLFLDEVGELPAELQVQLLRVVQEKRYKRLGSNAWHDTDFRLVAATNRNLWAEVQEGRFRRDLYYRLAVWTIDLPPLAERSEDILPLAEHFLRADDAEPAPVLTPAVRAYLLLRPYPGNIRDLQQLCRQMRGRHVGSQIYTAGDIPGVANASGAPERLDWQRGAFEEGVRRAIESGSSLKEITAAAAETAVRLALDGNGMSTGDASRKLQVTPRALQLRRKRNGQDKRV